MKTGLKEQAISLRKSGKTYSEIVLELGIAKSTLSIRLRSVDLAAQQTQRITDKRRAASLRGGNARREMRMKEIEEFRSLGISEVSILSERELLLIGTALYWAEGSKQSANSPSTGIIFGNQDYTMILVFLQWLTLLGVSEADRTYELYVHESRKVEIESFKSWWANALLIDSDQIVHVYLKQGNPATNRKNTADLYHGLFRIKVKASTALNRKIQGLIHGIATQLGSGVIGNTSAFEAEDSRIVP